MATHPRRTFSFNSDQTVYALHTPVDSPPPPPSPPENEPPKRDWIKRSCPNGTVYFTHRRAPVVVETAQFIANLRRIVSSTKSVIDPTNENYITDASVYWDECGKGNEERFNLEAGQELCVTRDGELLKVDHDKRQVSEARKGAVILISGTSPEFVYWKYISAHPCHHALPLQADDVVYKLFTLCKAQSTLEDKDDMIDLPISADQAQNLHKLLDDLADNENGLRSWLIASVLKKLAASPKYSAYLTLLDEIPDANDHIVGHYSAVWRRSFDFYNIFPSFGAAGAFLDRLNELHESAKTDRVVTSEWRNYVKIVIKQWTDANLLATVLMASTVGFLGLPNVTSFIQLFCFFSILCSVVSIITGTILIWQHQSHEQSNGDSGAKYLERAESLPGSLLVFAVLLSTPLTLLLWALICFIFCVVVYALYGFKLSADSTTGAIERTLAVLSVIVATGILALFITFWKLWYRKPAGAAKERKVANSALKLFVYLPLYLLFVIGLNAADVAWIYFYLWAAMDPNPRIAVNASHSIWQVYSTTINLYGFLLGFFNFFAWYILLRVALGFHPLRRGKHFSWAFSAPKVKLTIALLLGPIAALMVAAPFVGPFIALPVVQKWAWDHRCDGWPITAILSGDSLGTRPSTAAIYINGSNTFTFQLENDTFHLQIADSSAPLPQLQSIVYDLDSATFSGTCENSMQSSCSNGTIDLDLDSDSFLSFKFSAGAVVTAVDHDWQFANDAPSVLMRDAAGRDVLRTAVTDPNACSRLKICAANVPEEQYLVPMGLILSAQATFASSVTCNS